MDYSKLSKQELVTLLTSKKGKSSRSISKKEKNIDEDTSILAGDYPYGQCQFVPTRGTRKRCTRAATTSYGFCATHNSTVQARNHKKKKDEEENKRRQKETEDKKKPKKKKSVSLPPKKKKHSYTPSYPVESTTYNNELVVTKNKFNHFEHKKTGIVFDPKTKKACGVQTTSGKVYPLTEEHVLICERNGWPYQLPEDKEDTDEEYDNVTEEVVSDEEDEEESDEDEEEESDEDEEEDEDEESDEDSDEEESSD